MGNEEIKLFEFFRKQLDDFDENCKKLDNMVEELKTHFKAISVYK